MCVLTKVIYAERTGKSVRSSRAYVPFEYILIEGLCVKVMGIRPENLSLHNRIVAAKFYLI
jgi:hypothetical protein